MRIVKRPDWSVVAALKSSGLSRLLTFWGLNYRRSWRAWQNPLAFDGENLPKRALQAIVSAAAH